MATDFGPLGPLVSSVGSIASAVAAIVLAFKGREKWEPVEEDLPNFAQRIAGVVAAIAICGTWYFRDSLALNGVSGRSAMVTIALWCALALVVFALIYGVLVSVYTYERVVVVSPGKTDSQKIVGGFFLKPDAAAAQKTHKVTIQELFKGSGYDTDKLWNRGNRSLVKSGLMLGYVGLIVSGSLGLASIAMSMEQPDRPDLITATKKWITEAKAAKANRTIVSGAPLPTTLAASRAEFETAWRNAGLKDRLLLQPDDAAMALSSTVGIYRIQEQNESTKVNSLHWADEAIRHFEERQDRPRLVEALLDKAAIMLDLAQLGNTDKETFDNVSRTGDALIARATEIASQDKKAEVLRLSSRFYYNLARPKSFRLSDAWDNNFLLLAYDRAVRAYEILPSDIKNANQRLRSAIKAAKNPPQNTDDEWAKKLREAQAAMKASWGANDAITTSGRISPLSVLGTGTLESVARDWRGHTSASKRTAAKQLLAELESDGLSKLREAEALLQDSELKTAYGFDIYYDIARAYAQRVVMLRVTDRRQASQEFDQVKINLKNARENANTKQLDAAVKDIDTDLSFVALETSEKSQLRSLLRGTAL